MRMREPSTGDRREAPDVHTDRVQEILLRLGELLPEP
jgi:hypothetical protein